VIAFVPVVILEQRGLSATLAALIDVRAATLVALPDGAGDRGRKPPRMFRARRVGAVVAKQHRGRPKVGLARLAPGFDLWRRAGAGGVLAFAQLGDQNLERLALHLDEVPRRVAVRQQVARFFEQCQLPRLRQLSTPHRLPRQSHHRLGAWTTLSHGPGSTARGRSGARFSVSRWLSGRSIPRLPDFLRLLEAITGRAAEWVSTLVPIERVPSLASEYRRVLAARNVAVDYAWSEAMMRVMETTGFRGHRGDSVAFIAEALGASDADIRQGLLALEQAGLIEAYQRAYRVTGTLMVDTKLSVQGRQRLRAHWATVAQRRVSADDNDSWFAYNVIASR
jgi:hypothetical protein